MGDIFSSLLILFCPTSLPALVNNSALHLPFYSPVWVSSPPLHVEVQGSARSNGSDHSGNCLALHLEGKTGWGSCKPL